MKRMSIHRDMSKEAICVLMAEGNKNAYNALTVAMQVDPNLVLLLDTMNLRGAQITTAIIGYCGGYFPKFRECVLARDQQMLDFVNLKHPELKATRDRFRS